MKRETVIETVAELEELRYIRRSRRKARDNRRVYVDNHYFLIVYVKGRNTIGLVRCFVKALSSILMLTLKS